MERERERERERKAFILAINDLHIKALIMA